MKLSKPRITPLAESEWTEEQRKVLEPYHKEGRVYNVIGTLARHWDALKKFSPYHNIQKDAKYPPVLYTSSTKDDRVHPAHARKMVAKLESMGHAPLYYENIEGGHGGAADIKQRAYVTALEYMFLGTALKLR